MKRKILDDVLRQHPPGPLYHYTNQAGLLGIVRNKEIWATHTQYLNDAREFLHAVRIVQKELLLSRVAHGDETVREQLEGKFGWGSLPEAPESSDDKRVALREMMQSVTDPAGLARINVCVACFSTIRDSLSQWRAYAHRGGFCVAFNSDLLAQLVAAQGFYLAQCLYDHDQQHALVRALIEEVLEENLDPHTEVDTGERYRLQGGNLSAYLNRYAPMLKDRSFAEESEWRIITRPQSCTGERFGFREGKSMLVPHYRFPLRHEAGVFPSGIPLEEVIVGPTPDPARSIASVENFLVSEGYVVQPEFRIVKVTGSAVPYQDWR